MKRDRTLGSIIVVCFVLIFSALIVQVFYSGAMAADKKFNLRFQHYMGSEVDMIYDKWTKKVSQATGGQLGITFYRGGELVPNDQLMQSVSKGTLDMCEGYGGYWPGMIDVGKIESGLPSAWTNVEEAEYFYYGKGFIDLAREAYAERNVYFLAPSFGGPYNLITKKPVTSLKDLQGKKIRASAVVASILKKFDIPTVYLPAEELYVGMATGTIDGLIYGSSFDYSQIKLQEVAKYYTKLDLLYPGYADDLLINMDLWKALPDNLKAIIEMSVIYLAHDFHNYTTFNEQRTIESGLFNVSSLPAEDSAALASAAQELWNEEAAKSKRNAKAIQMLREMAKSAGRLK